MKLLLISIFLAVVILGGPFTLFAVIKILNGFFGGLKSKFVKLSGDAPLGLMFDWDKESYEHEITRIKVDFFELVRGGRSSTFSYTFEDKSAKKRSFVIPLKLPDADMKILTDSGLNNSPRSVSKAYANIEVEFKNGDSQRFKVSKKKILAAHNSEKETELPEKIDILEDALPDSWSVLTRVFPWRENVETEEGKAKKKASGGAPVPSGPVNFNVTKVWIEPGCIVCDACENEAPDVFQVLEDTCIVRDNAPLADGGAIEAAAEGCPVDVIKFTTVPKEAAG